jgi:hypothetical protein
MKRGQKRTRVRGKWNAVLRLGPSFLFKFHSLLEEWKQNNKKPYTKLFKVATAQTTQKHTHTYIVYRMSYTNGLEPAALYFFQGCGRTYAAANEQIGDASFSFVLSDDGTVRLGVCVCMCVRIMCLCLCVYDVYVCVCAYLYVYLYLYLYYVYVCVCA